MADKLAVWKQALIHLGSAPINTLTDAVVSVNVFNNAWPGVVEEAFSAGDWNFAKATVELVASVSGVASPGHAYVYDYPASYMRTVAVSPDTRFLTPFNSFLDEGSLLHSNTTPIYIRYISNVNMDDANIGTWPTMFWRYVAVKLAYETCERITQSTTREAVLNKLLTKALRRAKSVDARNEPGKEIPQGSWLRARRGDDRQGGDFSSVVGGEIILSEGDV